jgi:hypothetical protein
MALSKEYAVYMHDGKIQHPLSLPHCLRDEVNSVKEEGRLDTTEAYNL